jgi:ankyrin repeat protein
LIEEGKVDPECKQLGVPAICIAAAAPETDKLIEYLVTVGANVNATIKYNWNALHYAACYGKSDTVKLLVSLGGNFKAKNNGGETPLQLAQNQEHKEIVEFLKQVERR